MSDTPAIPILVVEDEEPIRRGLCDVLAYHGYAPTGVETGEDGLAEGQKGEYALVILDIMLPGKSGFEVCETLREERSRLPVLMLTARGSEDDIVRGFRCGADDYLTKPFALAELLVRVEALLRRSGALERLRPEPFSVAGFEIDPEEKTATNGDTQVELTRREVEILALFHRERGRIVSRRMLLQEVWGFESADRIETRTVDMHIAKLRKKLGDARELIETVRGEGYRYAGS